MTAELPRYANEGDACVDLVGQKRWEDKWGNKCFDTGLAVEIPTGFVGLIFPRSSISKTDMMLRNCVGVIDSGYRGPLIVKFKAHDKTKTGTARNYHYMEGDRIAQLMIIPCPQIEFVEVDELSDSDRGSGGFGSTGT